MSDATQERAAVVAWLRKRAKMYREQAGELTPGQYNSRLDAALRDEATADAIERGQHVDQPRPNPRKD